MGSKSASRCSCGTQQARNGISHLGRPFTEGLKHASWCMTSPILSPLRTLTPGVAISSRSACPRTPRTSHSSSSVTRRTLRMSDRYRLTRHVNGAAPIGTSRIRRPRPSTANASNRPLTASRGHCSTRHSSRRKPVHYRSRLAHPRTVTWSQRASNSIRKNRKRRASVAEVPYSLVDAISK